MRYKIIKSSNTVSLEDEVNSWIDSGWTPIGGIFGDRDGLYQAIIKEPKSDNPGPGPGFVPYELARIN